ncbi:HAD hydrolase family protein [Sharpea azabuensis]|uniref:HAD hydrolase family protein n=1 Tax=Sharpea porci TaxID=2652286 RepID=A0A844FT50_9FIRM|nr:HAD hydrolase family protein [Sharpea porci]MST88600.1 HAD hydrolase family protein [Sharpea porci]
MELFCFDVDGTLRQTGGEHIVPESTIQALRLLKEKGHKIIVSTGRGYDSLCRTQIFDIADFDGYVVNNGQLVLDGQRRIIEKHVMPVKMVHEVLDVANKLNLCVALKMDHRLMNKEADEYVYETQRYFGNIIPEVRAYDEKEDVYAICLYGPKGWDYAPYCKIEGLEIAPGLSTYADASLGAVSKASGNEVFCRLFHTDGYIAFGDSQNDLKMFENAKVSICMGNGDILTKKIADYVTSDLEDDGILKACMHYGWIKEGDLDE